MKEKIKPLIIGVAGSATTGKDLFSDLLIRELNHKYNFLARKCPFALDLKQDLEEFVRKKCGLNIFNLSPKDKSDLRGLMVWYGTEFMRNRHKGQYWIEKLKKRIGAYTNEAVYQKDLFIEYAVPLFIVPDVRFKQYEYDELDYIKENGILIYIDKYRVDYPIQIMNDSLDYRVKVESRTFINPANQHEALNNPILKKNADYVLEWEDCQGDIDKINYHCLGEVQRFITWAKEKGVLKLNG